MLHYVFDDVWCRARKDNYSEFVMAEDMSIFPCPNECLLLELDKSISNCLTPDMKRSIIPTKDFIA